MNAPAASAASARAASWKPDDVPSAKDKLVVVTGANSGLGLESARVLAKRGAHVILACRNLKKGEQALTQVRASYNDAHAEVWELDLGSLASVRDFAQRFAQKHTSLDILLNNAGIMAVPAEKTKDGFEAQIGTNHLGHFALTARLYPLLARAKGGRVVNVSSLMERVGTVVPDDLFFERRTYERWAAYGQSKLANLLFTLELARRLRAKQSTVTVTAAHPGYSATELTSNARLNPVFAFFGRLGVKLIAQTVDYGALPQLRAALDESAESGDYFGPKGFRQIRGEAALVRATPHAYDEETARNLWERSAELTAEPFGDLS